MLRPRRAPLTQLLLQPTGESQRGVGAPIAGHQHLGIAAAEEAWVEGLEGSKGKQWGRCNTHSWSSGGALEIHCPLPQKRHHAPARPPARTCSCWGVAPGSTAS